VASAQWLLGELEHGRWWEKGRGRHGPPSSRVVITSRGIRRSAERGRSSVGRRWLRRRS